MQRSPNPTPPLCDCGLNAIVTTSWTPWNPGRRYAKCPIDEEGCRFWRWIDEEMCPRSVQIIPGLLRRINRTEKELEDAKEKAQNWERKVKKLETKVRKLEIVLEQTAAKERKLYVALAITCGSLLVMWLFRSLDRKDVLQLPPGL